MSTCISSHGEFGSHTLDPLHFCSLCGVLDEDALRADLRSAKVEASNCAYQRDEARRERDKLSADCSRMLEESAAEVIRLSVELAQEKEFGAEFVTANDGLGRALVEARAEVDRLHSLRLNLEQHLGEAQADLAEAKAELKATKDNRLISAIFGHHKGAPKPFALYRRSGRGVVALGAEFPDGAAALRLADDGGWTTTSEGGAEYYRKTDIEIVWLSDELESLAEMERRCDELKARNDRWQQDWDKLRQQRDEIDSLLETAEDRANERADAIRQSAINGFGEVRKALLAALGREDDGRTQLVAYVADLKAERDRFAEAIANVTVFGRDRLSGDAYEIVTELLRGEIPEQVARAEASAVIGRVVEALDDEGVSTLQVGHLTAGDLANIAFIDSVRSLNIDLPLDDEDAELAGLDQVEVRANAVQDENDRLHKLVDDIRQGDGHEVCRAELTEAKEELERQRDDIEKAREVIDSDAYRLATGVTCMPGQPASCGDFHNGGHCVRPRGAEQLAQLFHETYERLAPDFGYRTREASAKPWSEVPEANRGLMVATCREVLAVIERRVAADKRVLDAADELRDALQELQSGDAANEINPEAWRFLAILGAAVDARRALDSGEAVEAPTRPVVEQVRHLNGPMVARLRQCAADTSPNWDGKVTVYPPEARELVALIDSAIEGHCPGCEVVVKAAQEWRQKHAPAVYAEDLTDEEHALIAAMDAHSRRARDSRSRAEHWLEAREAAGYCTQCGSHLSGEHFGSCPVADPSIAKPVASDPCTRLNNFGRRCLRLAHDIEEIACQFPGRAGGAA